MNRLLQHINQHIKLSSGNIEKLKKFFTIKSYKKKEYLLHFGSISRYEFFVIKGCLRTFIVDKNGTEHNIMFATENWWTGDIASFFNQTPTSYSIQALEKTDVLQISKEKWENLFIQIPEFGHYARVMFQNATVAQQSRIIQNLSYTAEERYLDFLAKSPNLIQRIPQKHIASYLGITPEFLSMLRNKLVHN